MPDENNPPLDIGAIADSIGNDLFGEKSGVEESPPPSSSAGSPPNDPFSALPKAWKKEKEPLWAKMDKEAREYIYSRENDVVKGFEQYSTGHKNWTELTTPFQQVISQHPDVNPVQVMQNLMKNHLALLQATPEQKKAMAQTLLKSYNIDMGTGTAQQALPPEVQQALGTVGQLRDELGRFKADLSARQVEDNKKIVEAFASDPANKYFEEVADDIIHLLQTGAAPALDKAYEMAIWANPAVRAKLLAEQAVDSTTSSKKPLNVEGSGGTPPTKPKTFEDSIEAVMVKNYGANWKQAH